uniref:Uncharacterized protein n=1 Tax=Anguilla anguilla TaxID=7936 RepID=A0A0E9Y0B7_ANGAN
MTVSNTMLP